MTVFAGQSETTRLKNLILIWAEPEDWFILQVSLLGNVVGKSEGPFDFNSGINIPDKCRSICVFFWHLAVVKISTSLLSQRSLTPTVRLVVAAVRPLRAEGPELLRGMNYLFFLFFSECCGDMWDLADRPQTLVALFLAIAASGWVLSKRKGCAWHWGGMISPWVNVKLFDLLLGHSQLEYVEMECIYCKCLVCSCLNRMNLFIYCETLGSRVVFCVKRCTV